MKSKIGSRSKMVEAIGGSIKSRISAIVNVTRAAALNAASTRSGKTPEYVRILLVDEDTLLKFEK
jgi:hypothetical protein